MRAWLLRTRAASVRDGHTLPFLQYVVTLALVEAVQEAARDALEAAGAAAEPSSGGADATAAQPPPPGVCRRAVDVRIKWPNDVYASGVKVGGVLCGSTYADGAFRVTVGVGLNVSNAAPTTCLDAVIAAAAAAAGAPRAPQPLNAGALLARALSRYETREALFTADGFACMERAYLYHWLHTGQPVTLLEEAREGGDGAPAAAREVALTIQGLTHSGYLLAVDGMGTRFELHPDGNSLDFFKGLVRKKLR
jgi:biotin--protein ligase